MSVYGRMRQECGRLLVMWMYQSLCCLPKKFYPALCCPAWRVLHQHKCGAARLAPAGRKCVTNV